MFRFQAKRGDVRHVKRGLRAKHVYNYYYLTSGPFAKGMLILFSVTAATNCTWNKLNNTNVANGQRYSAATNVTSCQSACATNASCTGVDWNNLDGSCWFSGPWSGTKNIGTSPGVDHYDIISCPG